MVEAQEVEETCRQEVEETHRTAVAKAEGLQGSHAGQVEGGARSLQAIRNEESGDSRVERLFQAAEAEGQDQGRKRGKGTSGGWWGGLVSKVVGEFSTEGFILLSGIG